MGGWLLKTNDGQYALGVATDGLAAERGRAWVIDTKERAVGLAENRRDHAFTVVPHEPQEDGYYWTYYCGEWVIVQLVSFVVIAGQEEHYSIKEFHRWGDKIPIPAGLVSVPVKKG